MGPGGSPGKPGSLDARFLILKVSDIKKKEPNEIICDRYNCCDFTDDKTKTQRIKPNLDLNSKPTLAIPKTLLYVIALPGGGLDLGGPEGCA